MSATASSSSGRLQIGLLGAGNIGTALARHFARLGHEVLLSNSRGPETLKEQAADLGVQAVTSAEAAKAKDFVVLTVPQLFVPRLKPPLDAAQPTTAVLIDTCNYYPEMRDGHISELDESGVDSVWTSKQIGRPVVKVFNSIFFMSLANAGKPAGTPGRIALPVAGDDAAAKARVQALVDSIGFDTVDAGGLADSWRQQPGMPCYCKDVPVDELKQLLAAADKSRIAQDRKAFCQFGVSVPTSRRACRMAQLGSILVTGATGDSLLPGKLIEAGANPGLVSSQEWANVEGYRVDIASLARWPVPLTTFEKYLRQHHQQLPQIASARQ